MSGDTLEAELLEFLLAACYDVPPAVRRISEWQMSPEWQAEVRKLADGSGRPLWGPSPLLNTPAYLLGFPVNCREDFGVPALVPVSSP